MIRWTLAIVGLLGGCVYGPDDFRKRVTSTDAVLIDTPPPPASSPSGEALHQVLYQDEFGSAVHSAGQRARMLAWLVSLELSPAQLRGLDGLCKSVEAIRRAEVVDRAKTGARESTYYGPIYAELIEVLAEGGTPDEQIYADLAQRLEAAHLQVHQEGPPLARQRQRAQGIIEAIILWMRSLNTKQAEGVSSARFFLRRRLGPLVNPGHYEWVVGSRWDGGDFDILRYTGTAEEAGGMDLAGLWQAEAYRIQPDPHLRLLQARAIMAMAVTEPGLMEAIQVLRGEREALDFSDLSAAEP
jgi:hypothetical protein